MKNEKLIKKIIIMVLAFAILITNRIPAMAAEKLSKDDFVTKMNDGKDTCDFFAVMDTLGTDNGVLAFVYDKNIDNSKKGVVKTSRGIKITSKDTTVIKKYGKGTVVKLSKDIAYKYGISWGGRFPSYLKGTKYVRTYKYVKTLDSGAVYTSRIHFYIDKSEKVLGVGFSRKVKDK